MKWIIRLLDFRLYQTGGEGGTTTGGIGTGGGGFFGPPPPEPPPPPAPPPAGPGEPGWDWAENRQTANIDRSSQYTHEAYASALEGMHQQSQASGPAMGAGAYDYELPDVAFGERLY